MRKFKIKNRQKRKYTRHASPQHSYPYATIFAGLLPMLILAIAFMATLFMNMNLREQAVSFNPSFSMPNISWPQFSLTALVQPLLGLPNLLTQPVRFDSFQLTLPDPRPAVVAIGSGFESFFAGLGTAGVLVLEGLGRVGDLFVQSMTQVWNHMAAGANTIWSATVEYTIRAGQILTASTLFLLDKTIWLILFLYQGIVSILTFIFVQLSAFADAVVRIILIPFQILGALWMKMKPYVDILGSHMVMAGADLQNGVQSFNELGSELSK